MDGISLIEQKAFSDSKDFSPLEAPGPSDCLYCFPEKAQSFEPFRWSFPEKYDAGKNKPYILPFYFKPELTRGTNLNSTSPEGELKLNNLPFETACITDV